MVQTRLDDEPFRAWVRGATIGSLEFTRFDVSNLQASATEATIRKLSNKPGTLFVSIVSSGFARNLQYDRSTTNGPGDLVVRDTISPWTVVHNGRVEVLDVALPRERLEKVLGPARFYAGLSVRHDLPTAAIARAFLQEMLLRGGELAPASAERTALIGIDLIAASIAEGMQMETPVALQRTLVVQRAKAYIDIRFGDPTLDPLQVAAAVGVSVRRLHELFHEDGQHVSDRIWRRRLEVAAQRLADPGLLHLQVGQVSYGCGFVSQGHFTRRFKDRYGLSPSDFRRQATTWASQDPVPDQPRDQRP